MQQRHKSGLTEVVNISPPSAQPCWIQGSRYRALKRAERTCIAVSK